jgi:hypothetical protein
VPQYIEMHSESKEVVCDVHAVCFVLTQKLRLVFQTSVIRAVFDKNTDLKALKQVTIRLLKILGIQEYSKFTKLIDS